MRRLASKSKPTVVSDSPHETKAFNRAQAKQEEEQRQLEVAEMQRLASIDATMAKQRELLEKSAQAAQRRNSRLKLMNDQVGDCYLGAVIIEGVVIWCSTLFHQLMR